MVTLPSKTTWKEVGWTPSPVYKMMTKKKKKAPAKNQIMVIQHVCNWLYYHGLCAYTNELLTNSVFCYHLHVTTFNLIYYCQLWTLKRVMPQKRNKIMILNFAVRWYLPEARSQNGWLDWLPQGLEDLIPDPLQPHHYSLKLRPLL